MEVQLHTPLKKNNRSWRNDECKNEWDFNDPLYKFTLTTSQTYDFKEITKGVWTGDWQGITFLRNALLRLDLGNTTGYQGEEVASQAGQACLLGTDHGISDTLLQRALQGILILQEKRGKWEVQITACL